MYQTQPTEGEPLIAPSTTDHPLYDSVVEACRTPGSAFTASATQPGISPATGQPGAVSVIRTWTAFVSSMAMV